MQKTTCSNLEKDSLFLSKKHNGYKSLIFRDKSDGKRTIIKPSSGGPPVPPWVLAKCQPGQRIRCSLIPPAPRYVLLPFWQFPRDFINDPCKGAFTNYVYKRKGVGSQNIDFL